MKVISSPTFKGRFESRQTVSFRIYGDAKHYRCMVALGPNETAKAVLNEHALKNGLAGIYDITEM